MNWCLPLQHLRPQWYQLILRVFFLFFMVFVWLWYVQGFTTACFSPKLLTFFVTSGLPAGSTQMTPDCSPCRGWRKTMTTIAECRFCWTSTRSVDFAKKNDCLSLSRTLNGFVKIRTHRSPTKIFKFPDGGGQTLPQTPRWRPLHSVSFQNLK